MNFPTSLSPSQLLAAMAEFKTTFAAASEAAQDELKQSAYAICANASPTELDRLLTALANAIGCGKRAVASELKDYKAEREDDEQKQHREERELPVIFYNGREYLAPTDASMRTYQVIQDHNALLDLEEAGYTRLKDRDTNTSPAEVELRKLQRRNNVTWTGALGGRSAGLFCDGPRKFLITESPEDVIADSNVDPAPLEQHLAVFFGAEALDPLAAAQLHVFKLWLRRARLALKSDSRMEVPILALVGPADSGKSLLQSLIKEALGGRIGYGYDYFCGKDKSNDDIVGADLIVLADEIAGNRDLVREGLKKWISNPEARCRALYSGGVALAPRNAVLICANDDSATALPPLNKSTFADRITYLKTFAPGIPLTDDSAKSRDELWSRLRGSLPGFLAACENMDTTNDPLAHGRWGVAAFHHPKIVSAIESADDNNPLSELLDRWLAAQKTGSWEGTADMLYQHLLLFSNGSLRDYVKTVIGLGRALPQLRNTATWRDRLTFAKRGNQNVWTITAVAEENAEQAAA